MISSLLNIIKVLNVSRYFKSLYIFCHKKLSCFTKKEIYNRIKSILRNFGIIPPLKILYLSCHSVLEYDEVTLLREIGFHVFSPGDYVDKDNPGKSWLRTNTKIPTEAEVADLNAFNSFGAFGPENKNRLSRTFVDRFDVIIVMHMPQWITLNWENIKHKNVLWRTIGQSNRQIEETMFYYRSNGLKIIRYSPLEKNIPNYIGEDAVIRFYKNPDEYFGWNGNINSVLTIAQDMESRADACHFDIYMSVTEKLESKLLGAGNYNSSINYCGEVSNDELISALQEHRCYFYTGTFPASYTLSFIEAWMTGIPVIAIGQKLMHDRFTDEGLYEVPHLIRNGIDGFYAESIDEIRNIITKLYDNHEFARMISISGRNAAINHFGKNKIKDQWKSFLISF